MDVKLNEIPAQSNRDSVLETAITSNDSEKKFFSSNDKTYIWLFPRLIGFIFIIILFLWIYQAEGGIGGNVSIMFGWYALLLALFIVVFSQEAVMAYSAPLLGPFTKNDKLLKYFHVTCHVLGIICAFGGLVGIVYYKKLAPGPVIFPFFTLYSPHSWLGVALLSLWTIQMTAGIYIQGLVKLTPDNKHTFAKYHGFLGKCIYALGLAVCAMGLQDMQSSDLASSTAPYLVTDPAEMAGYLPNSKLAQYASGGCLLLLLSGMATFATLLR